MTAPSPPRFTTRIVHADRWGGAEQGAVHQPIHTSVQYGHARVEDLIAVFQGTAKGGFNYARQGTPTTAALESKITQMEQGHGSIVFATGMAGICAVFLTLLKAGDHLVVSQFVFGNTNSALGTLADLGIAVSTVDVTDAAQVAAALRPNTRMVFLETIANPGTQIPDLDGIGALCKQHGLLYVVDNTVASPYLFRAASVGAGLVVNSLTKSIGGHGDALGGAVTDTGLYDWSGHPNIFAAYRKGDPKGWGLQQLRKKGLRDMGATLSSQAAHQLALGAETLALRMERSSASALALAQWLEQHPAIARVLYPMLPSHPQHAQARRHLRAGSWLLSFEPRDPAQCLPLCNRLRLPIRATGLADTRTLIIPVAHTIFWETGPAARAAMGITDGMIRLSVGLEEIEDLLADFEQALAPA
ncbi:cystathionine gamma-synthase family protein [Verminephrobacter aporrectodeae subsp. tuberculatae]|uniref:cystathionine gamma-synthase family protein n=1 Tax=Verminephrobacter aporrectodeae TaxID=1110389 RepID=UPI00223889F2|nr:cystathionine gamma-synthase family protein [Verminephrobacter aporrectodeae]MCW5223460.1 cystathionine gamma-synthase family protein [Verminephrobacter aporrectodeae subsp. tuberculatae]MCW5256334.1 cystathionine gamma-synthase family protein [Verminephrobacter aporrectodeae subsp. tuberculatae]MCW5288924.1 cystathionine gamma-synthase family protein [Verminephrobacter aporrectodeae subsp. tuberculatae]